VASALRYTEPTEIQPWEPWWRLCMVSNVVK